MIGGSSTQLRRHTNQQINIQQLLAYFRKSWKRDGVSQGGLQETNIYEDPTEIYNMYEFIILNYKLEYTYLIIDYKKIMVFYAQIKKIRASVNRGLFNIFLMYTQVCGME